MKKFIYLILIILLLVACRKKDSTNNPNVSQNSSAIIGQWEWFITKQFGPIRTPQNTGLYWGLKFNKDSTCNQTGTLYTNGTESYSLKKIIWWPTLPPDVHNISCNLFPYYPGYAYKINSLDTLLLIDYSVMLGQDGAVYYFVRK